MASGSHALMAQSTAGPEARATDTAQLLITIDQLVEQNRKLEQQNRQLIDQINALRKVVAAELPPPVENELPDGKTVRTVAVTASIPAAAPAPSSPNPVSPPLPTPAAPPPANQPPPQSPPAASGTGAANPNQNAGGFNGEASNGSPALFGEWNPGQGFTVAKTRYGQLDLSGYMVMRYLNQLPPSQNNATDHLGRPIPVQARQDFQFHRVLLYAKGWLFSPKFNYLTVIWTVNDTTQVAVGGALIYNFNKYLTLGGGYTALPGTQSMQGSHPYWPIV